MKSNSHVYESKHAGRKKNTLCEREAHLHERNKRKYSCTKISTLVGKINCGKVNTLCRKESMVAGM